MKRRLFGKNKGSITVLVALMLVPTIFFTGFFVDISRLKLYGNQAVMTADNYGEAVLTQYDNLLQDLYGLFAVTQDEDAIKALDDLQAYVKSSFNPSENTIDWQHLQSVQSLLGSGSYEGFMPYQTADVALSYEFVEDSDLRTHEILSTQIGDFMKFRIVQQLADDGSELLKMVELGQNQEADSQIYEKKDELDEKTKEIYEAASEYYKALKDIAEYLDYIGEYNKTLVGCNAEFADIADTDTYKKYYEYTTSDSEARDAAVKKRESINQGTSSETLTEDEEELLRIYDAYWNDAQARYEEIESDFDSEFNILKGAYVSDPIYPGNFEAKLDTLREQAKTIDAKIGDIQIIRDELEELLQQDDATEEVKTGVREELQRYDTLFTNAEYYSKIAEYVGKNSDLNTAYINRVTEIEDKLEEIKEGYLDCTGEEPEWPEQLNGNQWYEFTLNPSYNEFYESLAKCFEGDADDNGSQQKKDDADALIKSNDTEMAEEETSSARDIPEAFGYGSKYEGSFGFSDMISSAADMFRTNNFSNEANKLLLKIYLTEYDFGMFSSRVTNVKSQTEGGNADAVEKEESLTGYAFGKDINYLYGAELEYLLGGSDSSDENLKAAKDKIMAFRFVMNLTATYTVTEVNSAIRTITEAAMVANPLLGVVLGGTLRTAVAGCEMVADWQQLVKGESVVFLKTKVQDLSSYDKIKSLLGLGDRTAGTESTAFKLDYEQYLMLMMIFMTSTDILTERTADLIELNVNAVDQDIGKDGELSKLTFKMDNAYTAVDATCTVHLDFVFAPASYAKRVAGADTAASMTEFEKNSYKFTVTRGY